MTKIAVAAALTFCTTLPAFELAFAQNAKTVVAPRFPDYAGRDKNYARYKTRINTAIRQGANFASHYTIVVMGCGTGCTHNLMVNRRTGRVLDVPYGGEMQQMLTLRHSRSSSLLVATWFDGDLCVLQRASWNGTAFSIAGSPKGQPNKVCEA